MSATAILDGVKRRGRHWLHDQASARVLQTPPIMPTGDPVVLFSMIGTKVLAPYLVAVKSLHSRLGRGRVQILDDGTLTLADRRILAHHLGDPKVTSLRDVDTGRCPRGGTWERLLTLLDLRAENYVIQLDSDTVTVGEVREVAEAVTANRNFILAGEAEGERLGVLPLTEFVAQRYPRGPTDGPAHIQLTLESRLAALPDAARYRYVRGCSGFAGFARGKGAGRAEAEHFSVAAAGLVGDERWSEWGSEQVTSNFLLANEPDPIVLPYARYLNYWLDEPPAGAQFVHFVGAHRFSTSAYRRFTERALACL